MLHIGNERPKTILHEWMHNSLKQYLLNSLTHSFSQGELFYMLKYAQREAINGCNNKIDRKPFEDFGSKIWQYAYINFPTHFRLGNNLTDVTYADLANNTSVINMIETREILPSSCLSMCKQIWEYLPRILLKLHNPLSSHKPDLSPRISMSLLHFLF